MKTEKGNAEDKKSIKLKKEHSRKNNQWSYELVLVKFNKIDKSLATLTRKNRHYTHQMSEIIWDIITDAVNFKTILRTWSKNSTYIIYIMHIILLTYTK